jgi:putative DNA primase/helicase
MDSVLGEYKTTMSVNMLTDRRGKVGSATPEMMALKGSRMAVAQEPQKGERLNDGVVKEFSSGEDKLQGRALYSGKMVEFLPQFQLVICTNYLPEITSNDHGIWRRVRVVPFKSLFTENPVDDDPDKPYQFKIDRKISQRMELWKEAFAAMLIDRAYENQGMVPDCDIVMAASNEYRQGQDCIAQYINERIVMDPSGVVSKTEIGADFKMWYESTYSRRGGPNAKEVYIELEKRKFKIKSGKWIGIRISYDDMINEEIEDEDVSEPNPI